MFGFLKRSNKGQIEKEFAWLSLKRIVSDLHEDSLTPMVVATGLCRLSIYGGLDLKKSIDEHKLLKNGDPDRLVVEGVAFTWSHIYRACLKSSNVDIYENEGLADAVYSCPAGLHAILDKYTNFDLAKNYTAPYSNNDLIKSTEALAGRLLEAGDVEMLGDIKDNVGTVAATNIYASTMLPAIVEASINLLRIYLNPDDFK